MEGFGGGVGGFGVTFGNLCGGVGFGHFWWDGRTSTVVYEAEQHATDAQFAMSISQHEKHKWLAEILFFKVKKTYCMLGVCFLDSMVS